MLSDSSVPSSCLGRTDPERRNDLPAGQCRETEWSQAQLHPSSALYLLRSEIQFLLLGVLARGVIPGSQLLVSRGGTLNALAKRDFKPTRSLDLQDQGLCVHVFLKLTPGLSRRCDRSCVRSVGEGSKAHRDLTPEARGLTSPRASHPYSTPSRLHTK